MTTPTLGSQIDKLDAIRERKRKLAEQIKAIEAEFSELESQVLQRLMDEETEAGRGKKASVSIGRTVVANIVDFDELCKYVKRTGHFHLFQRRVSDPAFRELAARKPVPGLEAFTKIKLNLTHLKSGE